MRYVVELANPPDGIERSGLLEPELISSFDLLYGETSVSAMPPACFCGAAPYR